MTDEDTYYDGSVAINDVLVVTFSQFHDGIFGFLDHLELAAETNQNSTATDITLVHQSHGLYCRRMSSKNAPISAN